LVPDLPPARGQGGAGQLFLHQPIYQPPDDPCKTGTESPTLGIEGRDFDALENHQIRSAPCPFAGQRRLGDGHAGTAIGHDVVEGWRCMVDGEHNGLRFIH